MNRLIYQQSEIILTTGDTFVETITFDVPASSGGLIVAKVSSIGFNRSAGRYHQLVNEMICGYQKNATTLTLGTTDTVYQDIAIIGSYLPTPSFVNSSNNLRVRFTRNGYSNDSSWMVDLELFWVRI